MNNTILLNDILNFSNEELDNCKIRLIHNHEDNNVLDLFLTNPNIINNDWLFWNYPDAKSSFKEGQIAISLVRMDKKKDLYLLTTIKKITKDLKVKDGISYNGIELEKYDKFFGRVIVKYHNKGQNLVRIANNIIDKLEVSQILSSKYDGREFPGYDKVCLKYNELKNIIDSNNFDWINALSNQKAVYLITDLYSGKLYVGKASSTEGMLLSRWSTYVKNGHGGNKELKKFKMSYIEKYFQYSIIENYNSKVSDEFIDQRERYWKKVLDSKNNGLNDN